MGRPAVSISVTTLTTVFVLISTQSRAIFGRHFLGDAYLSLLRDARGVTMFFYFGGINFPAIEGIPSNFVVTLSVLKVETFKYTCQ